MTALRYSRLVPGQADLVRIHDFEANRRVVVGRAFRQRSQRDVLRVEAVEVLPVDDLRGVAGLGIDHQNCAVGGKLQIAGGLIRSINLRRSLHSQVLAAVCEGVFKEDAMKFVLTAGGESLRVRSPDPALYLAFQRALNVSYPEHSEFLSWARAHTTEEQALEFLHKARDECGKTLTRHHR